MVNYTLTGLNENVTSVDSFTVTAAATETLGNYPILDLTMNVSDWNTLFAYGENIYHTYSDQFPALIDNGEGNETLANKNLTDPGQGQANDIADGQKLQEPEEADQTIAADAIRAWTFAITGARNQESLYSNIATINSNIDTLLTGDDSESTNLPYKFKATVSAADNLTDSNATTANLSRQLKLLTAASDAGRLTNGSGNIYNSANILSNLVGTLPTFEGLADGTYTSASLTSSGNGLNQEISSILVRGGRTVGIKFSNGGSGHAADDVLTFTIDGTEYPSNTYTLTAGDINSSGGFTNAIYNHLFKANDTVKFGLSVTPPTGTSAGLKNFVVKVTMA